MGELFEKAAGFALVLLLPLVIVGGAMVTLFAVGALFEAADHPHELRGRIDALFRRPPRPARPAPADHYYRPYWAGPS